PATPSQPAAKQDTEPEATPKEAAPEKPAAKQTRAKRGKAPMPSWEDVLLGVRSSGH
ncbi:septation protein SepH, partial [Nocardia neocaledoniensis]